MPRLSPALRLLATAAVVTGLAAECRAVEMFTFFGDGSRIGLPSLEVPVEAYSGIPLRSDRLRARRAARRQPAPAAAAPGQTTLARGITIREMPAPRKPTPRLQPTAARGPQPTEDVPVAPEPDEVLPPRVTPPLAE